MNYLGGTYVSQVEASSKQEAINKWIRILKTDEIDKFTKKDQEVLIENNFKDEEPVVLTGMKNVWNINVRTKKGFGYIHFIKTVS